MAACFYKAVRSDNHKELLKHPYEYALLSLIAYRAKRTDTFTALNLEQGEALIGDYESCGLTEQKYRTAKKNLEKWNFITTRSTNKGTIAKIINSNVFDINQEQANEQDNTSSTGSQRAANGQPTTNKNVKNVKKEKKLFGQSSVEYKLSSLLFELILERNSNHKKPDLNSWASEIDKMIRIDKRVPDEIEAVIRWCQADSGKGSWPGWQTIILSTANLREKYDKINIRRKPATYQPEYQEPTLEELAS